MGSKIRLTGRAPDTTIKVLGWILFFLAVVYTFPIPVFMFPEALAPVDGKIEGLFLALCVLYLYTCGVKSFPWMILLVLAFSELHERPVVGATMVALSLALNLSPDHWWRLDSGVDLDDLDDDFSDLEDF